uniref:E3 ubiquitin-protein ligase MARCHF5 n=1 Tax=Panthera onca TaxID=9690 RepID=UPI002953A4E7|nr:E3 ubiquitin-protein ligase MARCHF5 [Panthera onca]
MPDQALQQMLDRSCWVCFATDEDDRTAEWVRPCRCRGSTKWVHQACLQRWVDEKQRGNSTARVACPQCNAEYLIVFPKLVYWRARFSIAFASMLLSIYRTNYICCLNIDQSSADCSLRHCTKRVKQTWPLPPGSFQSMMMLTWTDIRILRQLNKH